MFYSTKTLTRELGTEDYQIPRLFELGDLDEPPIVGGRRVIDESMIPQIILALARRGWWKGTVTKASQLPSELALV